uniref:7TM_GPCR_Srx domain-containing protein n=1 Tax=Steinernema glaseri TaxID=37863 RepID=A0A1I7YBC2_9BILA
MCNVAIPYGSVGYYTLIRVTFLSHWLLLPDEVLDNNEGCPTVVLRYRFYFFVSSNSWFNFGMHKDGRFSLTLWIIMKVLISLMVECQGEPFFYSF